MKKLYRFTVKKDTEEKIKESSVNEEGNTVTVEKSEKKIIEEKAFIRKPSRALFDEAELFYGIRLSEGIKAGLLTRALLAKRFLNDGGILSEKEKEKYVQLISGLSEIQLAAEEELSKDKGAQDDKKLGELSEESNKVKAELTELEANQSALFDQTAENRARNKVILWWILALSYFEDKDGKETQVFAGNTHEERLVSYDAVEEKDDPFLNEVIRKFMYYISFWYVGRAQTEEDFKNLE